VRVLGPSLASLPSLPAILQHGYGFYPWLLSKVKLVTRGFAAVFLTEDSCFSFSKMHPTIPTGLSKRRSGRQGYQRHKLLDCLQKKPTHFILSASIIFSCILTLPCKLSDSSAFFHQVCSLVLDLCKISIIGINIQK